MVTIARATRDTYNLDVVNTNGVCAGWTGSNLVTTPQVAAKFAWSLYGPEPDILPKSFADLMLPLPGKWYGLGTMDLQYLTGPGDQRKAYGHAGITYGYQGGYVYVPDLEFAMAVSMNVEMDEVLWYDVARDAFAAVAQHLCKSKAICGGLPSGLRNETVV